MVSGESDMTSYGVTVKKMSDGALLASTVVTIRASSSEAAGVTSFGRAVIFLCDSTEFRR